MRLTCAVADGQCIYAVRYATTGQAKSLYRNKDCRALQEITKGAEYDLPERGQLFLSEPLDDCSAHWEQIPAGSFAWMEGGRVEVAPFEPMAP